MIAEIIGTDGKVHYRRPPGDVLVTEALRTSGYSVRYVSEPGEDWQLSEQTRAELREIDIAIGVARTKSL